MHFVNNYQRVVKFGLNAVNLGLGERVQIQRRRLRLFEFPTRLVLVLWMRLFFLTRNGLVYDSAKLNVSHEFIRRIYNGAYLRNDRFSRQSAHVQGVDFIQVLVAGASSQVPQPVIGLPEFSLVKQLQPKIILHVLGRDHRDALRQSHLG